MFMKILWSLSLQSMQLPLTGWYRLLSCEKHGGHQRGSVGRPGQAAAAGTTGSEAVTRQPLWPARLSC